MADALTQAIKREGGRDEEVAAALATQEMADAASGVMAEASRLASDIMTAGIALHGHDDMTAIHLPDKLELTGLSRENRMVVYFCLSQRLE